jgi:hypothetical protein
MSTEGGSSKSPKKKNKKEVINVYHTRSKVVVVQPIAKRRWTPVHSPLTTFSGEGNIIWDSIENIKRIKQIVSNTNEQYKTNTTRDLLNKIRCILVSEDIDAALRLIDCELNKNGI